MSKINSIINEAQQLARAQRSMIVVRVDDVLAIGEAHAALEARVKELADTLTEQRAEVDKANALIDDLREERNFLQNLTGVRGNKLEAAEAELERLKAQEPVAAIPAEEIFWLENNGKASASKHIIGQNGSMNLYAEPLPAAAAAPVTPDGWKLVPVEPTKEMCMQIHPIAVGRCIECDREVTTDCEENVILSWESMLAAAPEFNGGDK